MHGAAAAAVWHGFVFYCGYGSAIDLVPVPDIASVRKAFLTGCEMILAQLPVEHWIFRPRYFSEAPKNVHEAGGPVQQVGGVHPHPRGRREGIA